MVFSLFGKGKRRNDPPLLDTSIFERVLGGNDARACKQLAAQLLAFIDHAATPPAERALVMPCLVRLASHPLREVRAYTALKARDCIHLEAEVVFAIVAEEEAIALPFIEHAVCLDEKMQLAIFRAGDSARRKALCCRADLAASVLAEAINAAERDIVLTCLHNDAVSLAPAQARHLYARFRDDADIVRALLARPDLPLEVRIAHVEIESGRLREVMARADWQVAQRAAEATTNVEEQALVDILAGIDDEHNLQTALRFLTRRGKLTAAILLRAACAGHVAVLLHALAWLSGMRLRRLQGVLQPGASLAVARTALTRANLPAHAHALVLGILLAARRDTAAATRLGARIPALGPLLLETIAETDALTVSEKMEAASMLQRVGDKDARELAADFVQTLLRHAA